MKKTIKRKTTKKKSKRQSKKKGFTLIELLVVSTIIVVLSVVGLVSFSSASQKARDAQRKADVESVRAAAVLYKIDNGFYPSGETALMDIDTLVAERSVVEKLGSAVLNIVTVNQAHAVAEDDGFTSPFNDNAQHTISPGFIKRTPTPTPIVIIEETSIPTYTPTPTASASAIPTASASASPSALPITEIPREGASEFVIAVNELEEEGYLDEVPVDPKNNSSYYYTYVSDGSSFTVSALLEQDGGTLYTLTN